MTSPPSPTPRCMNCQRWQHWYRDRGRTLGMCGLQLPSWVAVVDDHTWGRTRYTEANESCDFHQPRLE